MVDDPAVEHQPSPSPTTKPCRNTSTSGGVGVVIGTIVFLALLVRTEWIHLDADYYSFLAGTGGGSVSRRGCHFRARSSTAHLIPIPFSCDSNDTSGPALCRRGASLAPEPSSSSSSQKHYSPGVPPPWCPDYFRHIHTDLEPWRTTGITRDAVERAHRHAELRLVVVSGRAYVEKYRQSYQTRDVFTEWGILQLLARYPGRVPDVDMMFATGDVIRVRAADYRDDPSAAPPLFRYCKDVEKEVAILWPDWSFWGWSEVNIRPWAALIEEVGRENARLPWRDREPYAFWKGNPGVSEARRDLFRCNNDSAAGKDWNTRLFKQGLGRRRPERVQGLQLGQAVPVQVQDLRGGAGVVGTSSRGGSSPGNTTGPSTLANKCRAIKLAVDWGNAHPDEARRMGQEGSGFAREEMDMELVYEYMLHVLTQYAALLRYKPTVPEKAVELCPESMACPRSGRERDFMMESREKYVATCEPCTLPPPFTADEVLDMAVRDDGVRSKLLHIMDGD
ncbi:hypothetical protein ACQ4PT_050252 [Festuca glaucescens]